MEFYQKDLSQETLWRSVILFGRNVASYKFALAKSLLELAEGGATRVSLEELAPLYSDAICDHIKTSPVQGTFKSSKFLNACNAFNSERITKERLVGETVKLGFNNVIDAFHVVNNDNIPVRFFHDERGKNRGIAITDELLSLVESNQFDSLPREIEARWRLVETAWSLKISPNLLTVSYESIGDLITFKNPAVRIDISSCRDSLNGYQKGRCFYSGVKISINSDSTEFCDIDHFFPHTLKQHKEFSNVNLDGIWNLVLSARDCNRGTNGKFAKLPNLKFLEKLYSRNEYYISSHHPLRETVINQTGKTKQIRREFLQRIYNKSKERLIHTWEPEQGIANETI